MYVCLTGFKEKLNLNWSPPPHASPATRARLEHRAYCLPFAARDAGTATASTYELAYQQSSLSLRARRVPRQLRDYLLHGEM